MVLLPRARRWFGVSAAVVLSSIPLGYAAWVVASTGANNVSNDFALYLGAIDQILSGTYQWKNFFADTFVGDFHSMLFPVLMHLTIAQWFDFNVYVELFICLGLFGVKLFLLHDLITQGMRSWLRWAALPILSLLVFGLTQIDTFTYGDAATQAALSHLGVIGGIWALVRFRGQTRGLILMALGGVLATFSGGGGILCWPVFFGASVLLGIRSRRHYAVLCTVALAVGLPVLLHVRKPGGLPDDTSDPLLFVKALGWAFSRHHRLLLGWMAVTLLATGAALAVVLQRAAIRRISTFAGPLMVLAFGLLNTAAICLGRGRLNPWYSAHELIPWLGLCGVAIVAFNEWSRSQSSSLASRFVLAWCVVTLSVPTALTLGTNSKYEERAFYLKSRAPVSAEVLRHYAEVPTYMDKHVIQWGPGVFGTFRRFAEVLERRGLSVFAREQTWSLQGNYGLGDVTVSAEAGAEPYWREGRTGAARSWQAWSHLELIFKQSCTVTWTFRLPENLAAAGFYSLVRNDAGSEEKRWEVRVFCDGRLFAERTSGTEDSKPTELNLSALAGREVALVLSGENASFAYPIVNVRLTEGTHSVPAQVRPRNTDLSGIFDTGGPGDEVLDFSRAKLRNLERTESGSFTITGDEPRIDLIGLDLKAEKFRGIVFKAALPRSVGRQLVTILFEDQSGTEHAADVPLIGDGQAHAYSIPLVVSGLPITGTIVRVQVLTAHLAGKQTGIAQEFSELKLLAK